MIDTRTFTAEVVSFKIVTEQFQMVTCLPLTSTKYERLLNLSCFKNCSFQFHDIFLGLGVKFYSHCVHSAGRSKDRIFQLLKMAYPLSLRVLQEKFHSLKVCALVICLLRHVSIWNRTESH